MTDLEIYFKVQHQLLLEDADYRIQEYCDNHDLDYDVLSKNINKEELVKKFEKYQSCDVSELDTWDLAIDVYFREKGKEEWRK